jgi:hypothetical protein
MRLKRAQEFVIGGYTMGGKMLMGWSLGCCEGERFACVDRTHSGFTPAFRAQL